jgi:iron-sulfur cluster repair protein YtfE (RIC family)
MPDGDSTLPDWLIDVPASAAVFKRYGLDTSCGGKSLGYVCRQAGIDPEHILRELRSLASPPAGSKAH